LDPREPVADVRNASRKPALVVLVVLTIPVSTCSPLPSLRWLICISHILIKRDTEYYPSSFCGSSLPISFILPLLVLFVSVVSGRARVFDLLAAHRAVLGSTLNQLYDAELVEDMATLELSCGHHMVLANSAVLWMLDSSLNAFVSRVRLISLNLYLANNDVGIYDKLDLREVLLQIGHEYLELKVLFEISVHLPYGLQKCFANPNVTKQIQIHSFNDEQEQIVEHVKHIDTEIDHKLILDHVDLVFIKVRAAALLRMVVF